MNELDYLFDLDVLEFIPEIRKHYIENNRPNYFKGYIRETISQDIILKLNLYMYIELDFAAMNKNEEREEQIRNDLDILYYALDKKSLSTLNKILVYYGNDLKKIVLDFDKYEVLF